MAFPQAKVTFPGITDIVGFNYSLEHGISPGVATITLAPQKGWPAKSGNIVLSFGDNFRITLQNFVPDTLSFQFDQSGLLWRLNLLDRRVKWRYGKITGLYNQRLPHGPVDRIEPRTEANVLTLMQECLKAMGEKKFQIAVGALPKVRPFIAWDYSNPAQELAALCDLCGMRVVLRTDNMVAILPKGKGGLGGDQPPQLPNGPIISDSGTFDPPERPKSIIFVCGSTLSQVDLALEAVADDIDGLVKPIDEVSYRPQNGWKTGNFVTFRHVPLLPDNASAQDNWNTLCSPRELAKQSVYRKYRVTPFGINGKAVTPAGFKDAIRDVRQILPIGQQLLEPTFSLERGWYRPVNCIVWGSFARGTVNNVEPVEIEFKDGRKGSLPIPLIYPHISPDTGVRSKQWDSTVVFPDEYNIDGETGIITFNKRYLRFINNDDPNLQEVNPAIMFIRTAVSVSDVKTLMTNRYEVERKLKNPTTSNSAYIRDDDLFVRYRPNGYKKGSGIEGSKSVIDNIEEVKKYANERLDAEERKYQTKGPRAVKYAGWLNISPDGAIMQVSWSMGSGGAYTDASLNDEIAVLTVPYAERRFIEKIQSTKANDALNAASRLASERAYPFSRASGISKSGR